MYRDQSSRLYRAMPVIIMLLACAAVVLLWTVLRRDQVSRVASNVEAVSYAVRSEMARQLIVQFRAFDRIREFWSDYALIPVEQWQADARIEIDHFEGLDAIGWVERSGPRFFTDGPGIALDHVPTDEEWAIIRDSVDEAFTVTTDSVSAPILDGEAHAILRLYLPVRMADREAVMIVVLDVTEQIAAMLQDASPGYDIRVSCCDGIELYRGGDFEAALPEAWIHGGLIEPIDGLLWRVEHQPSAALAADFRPWSLNTVLVVGLALALAVGAIAYHSRRADDRARAARIAERQVRALNQELEARVARRTQDLNDALADLNTISLSVAHDVRSPMNAAALTVDALLAANGDDAQTAQRLNRIKSGLDQIDVILDRLLALSRVSALSTERTAVDLEALTRRVGTEVLAGSAAELTVGSMPQAWVDPTMAHILITNLLSNAVRHAGAGATGTSASIEAGSRAQDGARVCFIRDHGPGIDPKLRDELFKPASRPRCGGPGLGLGLAIAARVVTRHGGSLWVEDTPGGGATFCFTLPDQDRMDDGAAGEHRPNPA